MSRVARRVIVGRFDDASSARDSRTAAAGADARMKRRTVVQLHRPSSRRKMLEFPAKKVQLQRNKTKRMVGDLKSGTG